MAIQFVRVPPETVEIALGIVVNMPAVAVLGIDDGQVVGSGGLAWGGGKAWIWFKMLASKPSYSVPIFRATKAMLRRAVQLGETAIYTPRDANEPMSEKLLTMLGFELAEMQDGVEIWKWAPHG